MDGNRHGEDGTNQRNTKERTERVYLLLMVGNQKKQ